MTSYFYFLGLGSNLQPEANLQRALYELQQRHGRLLVWPLLKTEPVAMASSKPFVNTLVLLRSSLTPACLKAQFNALEQQLGRDRSDPLSAVKDRPLDIDILAQQSQLNALVLQQFREPYVAQVLDAASQPGKHKKGVEIKLWDHTLGQRAATIDTHHTTGHVVVIEDSLDRLFERFEPPLDCEQSLS